MLSSNRYLAGGGRTRLSGLAPAQNGLLFHQAVARRSEETTKS